MNGPEARTARLDSPAAASDRLAAGEEPTLTPQPTSRDLQRPARERWLRRGAVFAVLVACLIVFFRGPLASGLTLLHGDSYDGGIEVAILNHWYNVLAHGAAWDVTGWFAPHPGTLGYNDTHVIPGLVVAAARMAGVDPFLATFVAHVAMKAIGFLGMAALLRGGLGLRLALALAGAALFATANASLLHMHHAQLLGVGLVPWLMLLAMLSVRAALEDRARALWASGIGFALLFGLTALNGFYQLWFLCLFALAFVPAGWLTADRVERAAYATALRRHWRALIGIAAAAAVALIPFLALYLPKLAEAGGHGFASEVLPYLPRPSTYVNVGSGNLVWGQVLPPLRPGEHRFGFPLLLLALAIGAAIWAFRQPRGEARLVRVVAITLLVLVVLMTRIGDRTLWFLVYYWVPGAGGVRVITRMLLFLLIPVIAVAMLWMQRWRVPAPLAWGVVALLLAEQIQLDAPVQLDRAAQMRMLHGAGAPPAGCDSFLVVSAREPDAPLAQEAGRIAEVWGSAEPQVMLERYRHNVDAMLLASYWGRPTIGGFSTFNPPGWNFERPDAPDYLERARAYLRLFPAGRVCVLDRRRSPAWFPLG